MAEPKAKKTWSRLLRYAIGIALLALLIWRSGVGSLRHVVASADPAFVAIAFVMILLGAVVSVFRWDVFLKEIGHVDTFGRLARLYAAGLFFNSLLPTGIGGDVFKAVRVRRQDETVGPMVASLVLDRVAGFLGLAILGVVATLARLATGDHAPVVLAAGAVSLGAIAGVMLAFAARGFVRRRLRGRRGGQISRVLDALDQGTKDWTAVVKGLGWGTTYQAIVVVFHLALLRAIHVNVPLGAVVAVVVVVTFASLVPFTINGLGVREATYVWALKQYALTSQSAIVVGLLTLALLLAASAIGGVVYLVGRFDAPPVEPAEA